MLPVLLTNDNGTSCQITKLLSPAEQQSGHKSSFVLARQGCISCPLVYLLMKDLIHVLSRIFEMALCGVFLCAMCVSLSRGSCNSLPSATTIMLLLF